jgi:hypothetical protein
MNRFDQGVRKAPVKLGAAAKCPLDKTATNGLEVNLMDALHLPLKEEHEVLHEHYSSGLKHDLEKCQSNCIITGFFPSS